MRIAITGGAGYIGSHTATLLLEAGHDILILDNFINAEEDVPERVAGVAGRCASFVHADITKPVEYRSTLERFAPEALIHFAGLKAVGDSVKNPLEYYRVNVGGSVILFQEMVRIGCTKLVFSSSATVYGDPVTIPIPEVHPLYPKNPYGHSKRMVEILIEDWGKADSELSAVNLRYFNPVGAHPSARIGESAAGIPNNLMPYIAEVAQKKRERLSVFGADYDTPDGTGVRDYIHVMDLAAAHLAALNLTTREKGVESINVGTGQGYSVLEMIRAFELASGCEVPYVVTGRRSGDVAVSLADPALAVQRLGWRAERGLNEMCRDTWAWQCGRNR